MNFSNAWLVIGNCSVPRPSRSSVNVTLILVVQDAVATAFISCAAAVVFQPCFAAPVSIVQLSLPSRTDPFVHSQMAWAGHNAKKSSASKRTPRVMISLNK